MIIRVMCVVTILCGAAAHGATNYVSGGGSHVPPFTNWAQAATDIQSAINAAEPGNLVLVQAGGYYGYGGYAGNASNVVVITKGITVKSTYYSEDEPQQQWPAWAQISGTWLRRCVYIGHSNAVLEGFILIDGESSEHGGGAYITGGATLNRCIITDCRAAIQGGGVNILGDGTMRNTLVARNRANFGGGVYAYKGGRLEHCTIVSNTANNAGGGINAVTGTSYLTVYNSIIYHNTPQDCYGLVRYVTCCAGMALPVFAGGGDCFTNAPNLVDLSGGDYRLRDGSPCIDRATNLAWQATGEDCETYPRIIGARADLGAFERSPLHYLAPVASNIWPFISWSTAATNLGLVLNAAGRGDTIMTASGTYVLAEEMAAEIPSEITLYGVNGPASTIINGNGEPASYLLPRAVVDGFTITNCNGGLVAREGAVVRNCWLLGNRGSSGAGVTLDRAQAERCLIAGNRAAQYGGGVQLGAGSALRSCLIMRNTAGRDGGGVYAAYGGAIANCTIVSNSANRGGGIYSYKGGTNINDIIYYNHATTGVANVECEGLDVWYAYCAMTPLVTNVFAGPGLLTNEPRFVNMAAGNFRLQAASPCREAGTNLPWMASALDLDGNPRLVGTRVDMGCYEYVPEPAGVVLLGIGFTMYKLQFTICRRRRRIK